MHDLWMTLRHAARSLARHPGFATVAVFTLALGVGASTGIFTFANAILLRPLPYADADRLVSIADITHGEISGVGMSNYRDWRRDNTVFDDMALAEGAADIIGGQAGEEAERVRGADVTSSFFHVLGVQPAIGRAFGPEDEFKGSDVSVIVLGDGLWQRRYGGRPDIVGRVIAFNGRPCTVIGVMPPGFWFAEGGSSEFYVPQRWTGSGRGQHQYTAIARLKAGITLEAAQAQMSTIARRIELEFPQARGWGVLLEPLRDEITGGMHEPLAVLAAAVGLLLLVAMANLGSLLLVRTASRAREAAIRAALGASRPRILRGVLVEVGLVALAGAALGSAAATGTGARRRARDPGAIPAADGCVDRLARPGIRAPCIGRGGAALERRAAPAVHAHRPRGRPEIVERGVRPGPGAEPPSSRGDHRRAGVRLRAAGRRRATRLEPGRPASGRPGVRHARAPDHAGATARRRRDARRPREVLRRSSRAGRGDPGSAVGGGHVGDAAEQPVPRAAASPSKGGRRPRNGARCPRRTAW